MNERMNYEVDVQRYPHWRYCPSGDYSLVEWG